MKKTIRITESELKNIIREAVNKLDKSRNQINENLSTYWCNRIWGCEENGYIENGKAMNFIDCFSTDKDVTRLLDACDMGNTDVINAFCKYAQKNGCNISADDVFNLNQGLMDSYMNESITRAIRKYLR